MKLFLITVLMVLVTVMSALAAPYRNITSRDVKAIIAKNPKVYLLDVRTPEEFRQGRIPGATLIPIGEFERRWQEVPPNRPIIVFCAVGSRSRPVAQFLAGQGYKDVYNMTDGIVGWSRNGFQVVK